MASVSMMAAMTIPMATMVMRLLRWWLCVMVGASKISP